MNFKYPLIFTLSDQNPDGARTATYRMYLEVYDPDAPPPASEVGGGTHWKQVGKNTTKSMKRPGMRVVKPLKVEVREMTSLGLITLRYSEKIANSSVINDTVLEIWVKENRESPGNKTILSWNVTALRDREQVI